MHDKYPIIDMYATGQNIKQIMQKRGLTVRDIQEYLGLATSQSIYHWFAGRSMPTVDNLYALSELFHIPVDAMLAGNRRESDYTYQKAFYDRLYLYYKKGLLLKVC